jgi:hypothetical protein
MIVEVFSSEIMRSILTYDAGKPTAVSSIFWSKVDVVTDDANTMTEDM